MSLESKLEFKSSEFEFFYFETLDYLESMILSRYELKNDSKIEVANITVLLDSCDQSLEERFKGIATLINNSLLRLEKEYPKLNKDQRLFYQPFNTWLDYFLTDSANVFEFEIWNPLEIEEVLGELEFLRDQASKYLGNWDYSTNKRVKSSRLRDFNQHRYISLLSSLQNKVAYYSVSFDQYGEAIHDVHELNEQIGLDCPDFEIQIYDLKDQRLISESQYDRFNNFIGKFNKVRSSHNEVGRLERLFQEIVIELNYFYSNE